MENIRVMISEEDVNKRIAEMGAQISEDYAGKEIHLIAILKGSVFFACELAKRITIPVQLILCQCLVMEIPENPQESLRSQKT